MLSSRGVVLATAAVVLAVAGLAYGVEEFVMVAASVGVLLALGAGSVRWRRNRARRALRLVTVTPQVELFPGQQAVVEITVTNTGKRPAPAVVVADPAGSWTLSHPGLSGSTLATTRRSPKDGRTRYDTVGALPGTDATPGGTALASALTPASTVPAVTEASGGLMSGLAGPSRRPPLDQRARHRRSVARGRALPPLSPGASAVASFGVPASARGLLTLSGVGLWCQDSFGLCAQWVAQAPVAHVIVFPTPAPPSRPVRPRPRHAGRRPDVGQALATSALAGDELHGLRPYAPGDRLTRLHWPSLSGAGEVMVREFVAPEAGSLSLLVDLRPSSHAGDSIERAVAEAAGIGLAALDQGITVELCTSTGESMLITPGTAARTTLLRALALLGPAGAPPTVARRWGDRPTGAAVWASTGDDLVLVTTSRGASSDTLPASVRHHADTVLVP